MSSSLKQPTDKDKASTYGNIFSLGFLVVSNYIKIKCCNTMVRTNKRTIVAKYDYKTGKHLMMQLGLWLISTQYSLLGPTSAVRENVFQC